MFEKKRINLRLLLYFHPSEAVTRVSVTDDKGKWALLEIIYPNVDCKIKQTDLHVERLE